MRWYRKDQMNMLEGQRIKQINISEDSLFITTNKGTHKFRIEGDCCSHSYFHEFLNVNQMLTWVAKSVEEIDMPEVPIEEYGEYEESILAYGYKFHTEGGYGIVVFRNSSNGYYGGYMEYDGLVDPSTIEGKELKEDWNL